MASGKIHTAATWGSTLSVLTYSAIQRVYQLELAPYLVGMLFNIIASPDQDVDNGFIGDYYLRKIGLGVWWFYLWEPYKLELAHRSFLSHFPVISSLFRLIYLIFPPIIFLIRRSTKLLIRSFLSLLLATPAVLVLYLIYLYGLEHLLVSFIFGYITADTVHYLFDEL